jgi:hypothetical protein
MSPKSDFVDICRIMRRRYCAGAALSRDGLVVEQISTYSHGRNTSRRRQAIAALKNVLPRREELPTLTVLQEEMTLATRECPATTATAAGHALHGSREKAGIHPVSMRQT